MKKLLVLLVLFVAVSVFMGGCTTMSETAHQREIRYKLVSDLQTKSFVEDWDTIWFADRSMGLTRYHPKVGM